MSEISVRAFDAMSQLVDPPAGLGVRDLAGMTKERADAIYAALHLLERLEGDRRDRRKSVNGWRIKRAAT